MRRILILLLLLAGSAPSWAQLDKVVTIRAKNQKVTSLLRTLCRVAKLNLVMGPELEGKKASLDLQDVKVGRILRYLAALNGFSVTATEDGRTILAGSKQALASFGDQTPRVIPLGSADAATTAAMLEKVYKGQLEAIPDPHTNSVILVPRSP